MSLRQRVAAPPGEAELSHFRTHKTALLLARLLLQPHRSHSREELADWLWPDAPADRGRANLSQTLLRLRRHFAERSAHRLAETELFPADHLHIRVCAPAFETDVSRFERRIRAAHAQTSPGGPYSNAPRDAFALWDTALQIYGGELLPGFYEDWIDGERQRLSQMHDDAHACREQAHAALRISSAAVAPLPLPPVVEATPAIVGFPLILTRFFGRAAELSQISELLTQTPPVRLVTLVGMGGIGKTRLAVETARRLAEASDGSPSPFTFTAFLPLADITDAAHLGNALLRGLAGETDARVREDPLPAVCRFLNERARTTGGRLLLILDNLEQLGTDGAPVVAQLLSDVPALTILATSRQPIGVAGEQEVAVGPLSVRGGEAGRLPPDAELFADRARLVRPNFAVSAHNERAVRDLCALLEGVPLALELAAAWARALAPAQIAARLHNRFELLALRGVFGGDLPKRHRSLRAALAWSYDLLPPSLQTFFAQLSVFRGGWTAEAAQEITGIRDVSEPLLLLAERSLILAEPDETANAAAGALRYRMLESLREFAEEQREVGESPGSSASLRLRHARYFEVLSRQGNRTIRTGRGIRPAITALDPERENLRTALQFALGPITAESPDDTADTTVCRTTGAQLAIQTVWLWSPEEGGGYLRQAAQTATALPEETALPLNAQIAALQGIAAMSRGDYDRANALLRESLALWEQLDNEEEIIATKNRLGTVAGRAGDSPGATAWWTECLAYARQTENPLLEAAILNNLASRGEGLAARRLWAEQAVALHRVHAPASHLLACSLNSVGSIALMQNDLDTARTYLEEAHRVAVADGADGMIGVTKAGLAELFLATGEELERADQLLREAQALFHEKGEPPRVVEILQLRFQVALQRGDPDVALRHAREQQQTARAAGLWDAAFLAKKQGEQAVALRDAGFAAW